MLVDFQLLIKESKLNKFILLFIETKLCAFDLRYGDNKKKNIYVAPNWLENRKKTFSCQEIASTKYIPWEGVKSFS